MSNAADLEFDLSELPSERAILDLPSRLDDGATIEDSMRALANIALAYHEDHRVTRDVRRVLRNVVNALGTLERRQKEHERAVEDRHAAFVATVNHGFERLERLIAGKQATMPPPGPTEGT